MIKSREAPYGLQYILRHNQVRQNNTAIITAPAKVLQDSGVDILCE